MEESNNLYDDLKSDAKGLLTASGVASALGTSSNLLSRFLNRQTPQNLPIGELFADFAIDSIKKSSDIPVSVSYVQKYPRVGSDVIPEELKTNIGSFLQDIFTPSSAHTDIFIKEGLPGESEELLRIFRNTGLDHLKREATGIIPPDKLQKAGGSMEAVLTKEFSPNTNISFIVKSPRNNISTAAHEFGHVINDSRAFSSSLNNNSILDKIRNAAGYLWQNLGVKSVTESDLIPSSINNTIYNAANNIKSPLLKDIVHYFSSASMPTPLVLATLPLTSSKTVRDTIGSLDSSGKTQEIMDWIGDNATAISALATAPRLIDEMATTIPGYKLTVDFWKEFNKGNKGVLGNHPLLSKASDLIGKKTPWLEGLKFIGRNSLHFIPALAPVAVSAISNYMNKVNENDGNRENPEAL